MIKKYVLFIWLLSNETVTRSWLKVEPVMISEHLFEIFSIIDHYAKNGGSEDV